MISRKHTTFALAAAAVLAGLVFILMYRSSPAPRLIAKPVQTPWTGYRHLSLVAKRDIDGSVLILLEDSEGGVEFGRSMGWKVSVESLPVDHVKHPPFVLAIDPVTGNMTNRDARYFIEAPDMAIYVLTNTPTITSLRDLKPPQNLVRLADNFQSAAFAGDSRIAYPYASIKGATYSPNWKYRAVAFSDGKVRTSSFAGFGDTVFNGNTYIQLIDGFTGKLLGSPIMLEGQRGCAPPRMGWLSKSDAIVLQSHERPDHVWVLTVEELLKE